MEHNSTADNLQKPTIKAERIDQLGPPLLASLYNGMDSDCSTETLSTEQELGDDECMSPVEEGEKTENSSSRKQRKGRTRLMFSRTQTRELERLYAANKYPKIRERRLIADQMSIAERRIQIWFQNRRAKAKREGELMDPIYSMPNEYRSLPDENVTVPPSLPLTPPSDAQTVNMNGMMQLSTQLFEPPRAHPPLPPPPPAEMPDTEFDPGYPDVDDEVSQPVSTLSTPTCLPDLGSGQILFFPAPIALPLPLTPDYNCTTLWSKESVINPKELEELLVTLLSSYMPKTLHATDGHRLEAFKGFVNTQCSLLQEMHTKYEAMLSNL